MGRAKDIVVKVLPSATANDFIRRTHYSGKSTQNSTLHLGAFLDGRLHGVMSFGSPMDKRKVLPLVHTADGVPCLWNEMLELNRLAFDEHLPRNSESRCLSIAFRLIRKNAGHIRWILSFSDGSQCGDGAIYRASGFVLTAIKPNTQIWEAPTGERFTRIGLTNAPTKGQQSQAKEIVKRVTGESVTEDGSASMKAYVDAGFKPVPGFQLRYIYLLDKSCKLNCPNLSFSRIDEMGAGMYKGEKITMAERQTNATEALPAVCVASSHEEGFDSTRSLNETNTKQTDDGI